MSVRLFVILAIGLFLQVAESKKIVTTLIVEPFLKLKDDASSRSGNDRYEGFMVDIMEEVAKRANFEYEFQLAEDGAYGSLNETTGQWTGLIGELVNKKADLAAAPLTIAPKRETYVDFAPFMNVGISVMMKKPSKLSVFSFFEPFSTGVWLAILFGYVAVSIVLFLVRRFSPCETGNEEQAEAAPSASITFRSRSLSGRIVGAVWWLVTFVIVASYAANLAANLTVERMTPPINSVEDLVNQHHVKYGSLRRGSTAQFFQTSTNPLHQKMNAVLLREPTLQADDIADGIRRVRNSNGKYAFLLESSMNDFTNARQPCDTMRVGGNLDSKKYGLATPKGSDLKESIASAVREIQDNGILKQLESKWWVEKGECDATASPVKEVETVFTLERLAGVVYVLLIGLAIALVVLLIEFLLAAKKDANTHQVSIGQAARQRANCCGRA